MLSLREKELLKEISRLRRQLDRADTKENGAGSSLILTDGITAPGAVVGLAIVYIDTADGDLKVKFGDGITKTIATDT